MSKRLGELLIERGRITAEQLELALRSQLMLGGHLGTCLIELGYVDEDTLGSALSALLEVPYATRAMLAGVPPALTRILSKKLVEECQAIPFKAKDKSLGVAMVDPRNEPLLDEVHFASGMKVVPWVSPEVRIFEAMETYYDIPRRARYIAICRAMDRFAEDKAAGRATAPFPTAPPPAAPADRSSSAAFVDFGVEYGYGRSWVEVAEELYVKDPALGIRREPDTELPAPPADLEELAERLCDAKDKDAVARQVLGFAGNDLGRAALLSVRNDRIRVWAAHGFDGPEPAPPFQLATSGVFDHVLGQDHYCGPAGRDHAELRFFAWLGIEPPAEIVLVPIHLNDRLVAFFYGDGGPDGAIGAEADDYRRLGRMIGLALNAVILRKKLLAAASPSDSGVPR